MCISGDCMEICISLSKVKEFESLLFTLFLNCYFFLLNLVWILKKSIIKLVGITFSSLDETHNTFVGSLGFCLLGLNKVEVMWLILCFEWMCRNKSGFVCLGAQKVKIS